MEFLDLLKQTELEIFEKQLDIDLKQSQFNEWSENEKTTLKEKEIKEEKENLAYKYQNRIFDKTRKYKILYFLYGLYIYSNNIISNNNYTPLIINENKKWWAFRNGPVFNTYKYMEEDEKIIINMENMSKNEIEIVKKSLKLLLNFSTKFLIEKSHKTTPWITKYEHGKTYTEIEDQLIVNYFKENKPLV